MLHSCTRGIWLSSCVKVMGITSLAACLNVVLSPVAVFFRFISVYMQLGCEESILILMSFSVHICLLAVRLACTCVPRRPRGPPDTQCFVQDSPRTITIPTALCILTRRTLDSLMISSFAENRGCSAYDWRGNEAGGQGTRAVLFADGLFPCSVLRVRQSRYVLCASQPFRAGVQPYSSRNGIR